MTKIKICGIRRDEDIRLVNEARPDYIGFILNFPKSHRNITPARAAQLKAMLTPEIKAVGVFVNQPLETVANVAHRGIVDVIQLHGQEDEDYIVRLRQLTDIPIWKAFKIRSQADLSAAAACSADEILLDNGYGTGQCFDWSLTGGLTRPFLLAGGLTPENIPQAIALMAPKLIDISSGVETDGVKDRDKVLAAVAAVRANEN
jgi:phosphoribosylanthranilate isomerase